MNAQRVNIKTDVRQEVMLHTVFAWSNVVAIIYFIAQFCVRLFESGDYSRAGFSIQTLAFSRNHSNVGNMQKKQSHSTLQTNQLIFSLISNFLLITANCMQLNLTSYPLHVCIRIISCMHCHWVTRVFDVRTCYLNSSRAQQLLLESSDYFFQCIWMCSFYSRAVSQ